MSELPSLPVPFTAQPMCGEDTSLYTADQMHAHAAAAVAAALSAAQPEPPAAQPVAWLYRFSNGHMMVTLPTDEVPTLLERGWKPLYLASKPCSNS